jgi:glycosyltransferase involved in cell wall biosynthesis
MPATFAKADVLFAALKDEPAFALTVPAKIQAYMSSGKPIVTMINGEAMALVREVGCGEAVAAEDAEGFAEAILRMSQLTEAERHEIGERGKRFATENFDFAKQMNLLEQVMELTDEK